MTRLAFRHTPVRCSRLCVRALIPIHFLSFTTLNLISSVAYCHDDTRRQSRRARRRRALRVARVHQHITTARRVREQMPRRARSRKALSRQNSNRMATRSFFTAPRNGNSISTASLTVRTERTAYWLSIAEEINWAPSRSYALQTNRLLHCTELNSTNKIVIMSTQIVTGDLESES